MSKRFLFLLADGFEETEVAVPFDILMRGGIEVTLASIAEICVQGAHGLSVKAQSLLSEEDLASYSGVFVPGGSRGVENLRQSSEVLETVRSFHRDGKWVAAICAGPLVLADAGVLSDKRATSYPTTEGELSPFCKSYADDRVVVDGNVVTSRGPGSAEEFGFRLLTLLAGESVAENVRKGMISRR